MLRHRGDKCNVCWWRGPIKRMAHIHMHVFVCSAWWECCAGGRTKNFRRNKALESKGRKASGMVAVGRGDGKNMDGCKKCGRSYTQWAPWCHSQLPLTHTQTQITHSPIGCTLDGDSCAPWFFPAWHTCAHTRKLATPETLVTQTGTSVT